MTYQIVLKSNGTANSVPTTSDLSPYELGINTADGNLYVNAGTKILHIASTSNLTTGTVPPINHSNLVFEKISSDTTNSDFSYYGQTYALANLTTYLGNISSTSLNVNNTFNYGATLTNKKIEQVGANYCGVFYKGSSNIIKYTTDGASWNSATLPVTTNWQELAYNAANDTLVVVSSNTNKVYGNNTLTGFISSPFLPLTNGYRSSVRSPFGYCIVTNGQCSWLVSNTESLKGLYNSYLGVLPVSADWRDITWNGSVFCAVAYNTAIAATSPDGITWTQRTLPASRAWISIANNGSTLCAIAYNTNKVSVSLDAGVTWLEYDLPTSRQWIKIASNGSDFVAVTNNTNYVAVSTDSGVTWTEYPNLPIVNTMTLFWDGSRYVTCYSPNGGSTPSVSVDGINWTVAPVIGLRYLIGFNYLPDLGIYCVAGLYDGSLWSPNLINWYTLHTNYPLYGNYNSGGYPITFGEFTENGVTYGFAISINPRIYIFHTMVSGYAPTEEMFYGGVRPVASQHVCFGNGTFVAVSNTQLLYSSDGINWNYNRLPTVNGLDTYYFYNSAAMAWTNLIWTGTLFVLMTSNNTEYLTSSDGIIWTVRTLPVNLVWTSLTYSDNTLYLTSSTVTNSNLYLSTDGINWTTATLLKAADWRFATTIGSDLLVCDVTGVLYLKKTTTVWKTFKLSNDTSYATNIFNLNSSTTIISTNTTNIYTIAVDTAGYQFLTDSRNRYSSYLVI